MPSRNRIKPYITDGIYHVYNRGVNRTIIFYDALDYQVFYKYLNLLLAPPDPNFTRAKRLKNYSTTISLVGFCLMPNHFHFLLQQHAERSMPEFMCSLMTAYSMYFNKRHNRVGGLFQEAYKGIIVKTNEQLIHTSRYIDRNPIALGVEPKDYAYSSYSSIFQAQPIAWIKPKTVLQLFDSDNNYKHFVEDLSIDTINVLGSLSIDAKDCAITRPLLAQGVAL